MASRRLDRLGLDAIVCDRLQQSGIVTVRDVLTATPLALMLLADMSLGEVNSLFNDIAAKVHGKPATALEILRERVNKERFLLTGIPPLDQAMKGGLLIGCISEICGAPSVGKTQFCLSCTLQTVADAHKGAIRSGGSIAAIPGNARKGVMYIDTELKFDPNRLIQMALECYPEIYSREHRIDAPHLVDELLDAVKVSIECCVTYLYITWHPAH